MTALRSPQRREVFINLIVTAGGFIFYNTNVVTAYRTASGRIARRAEYERRYGEYKSIPQPSLTRTSLRVEIYPTRRAAEIRGTYILENRSSAAIDSIHLATSSEVETGAVTFDPPADVVTADDNVAIRIYHDPRAQHSANLERMVRGIRAALDYFTEQFGPYPYGYLTVVERGSNGDALHAEASLIHYGEGFSLFRPQDQDPDIVFFAMARVVANQWWEHGLIPAGVEGEVVMAESLANYSGMTVLERTYGHEHLERYLREVLWVFYEAPRTRAAVPLLRADNAFLGYRKGAQALYGLSRYIGEERMNSALRRLFEKHKSGMPPLPTTRDLYAELQAVTPDTFQYLLHDLFETNTFWELETQRAMAEQTGAGTWKVTVDVRARKVVVDTAGVETELPMDDWVEVGVFAPAETGEASDTPLYLQKHRILSARQTITVTVPRKPARAGIDPDHLLIDLKMDDNIKTVKAKS